MKFSEVGKLLLGVALGSMLGVIVYQSSRISLDKNKLLHFAANAGDMTSSDIDPCVGTQSCIPECGCGNCGTTAELCACDPSNAACFASSTDPCSTNSCSPECACNCANPYDSCMCEINDPVMCGSSSSYSPPPSSSDSSPSSSSFSSDPCASSASA